MSRIYWDTMLFIYLLEGHPQHFPRVQQLLKQSYERGDSLYSSYLGLGELMAGVGKTANTPTASVIRETLDEMGFTFLPFDDGSVQPFSKLRSVEKLKAGDAIHLACAASAGIDLFLTGDKQLQKLYVSGVQFIADFYNPVL
ncbi:putative nucleic acid-binding protein [Silvibacterium bohemicum]|uniref:Putative nucleic acid-binding protein n=1 Tax=Silvibacterium bohemicum TaxID=1577686 RepID=A0A841JX13_9BACT|nr:PIN domain-containing protein [Silvibacterium bohemicum]MBB6144977.1 putative nucleic acid-binding protein [Silvibacterium bohemicum]